MMKRRVVITGLGAVTPLGNNVEEFWQNALDGVNGVGPITRFTDELPAKVAAEVRNFTPEQFIEPKEVKKMDRFTQYAMVAALEAFKDSNIQMEETDPTRVGVWIGSGIGGIETLVNQMDVYKEKGQRRVSPFMIPMMIPDMAAGQVSIALGAKGPNACTVTACASGTNSIGDAFKVIQRGDADVMVTGGAEAPLVPLALAGFCSSRALSTNPDPDQACRPFDKNRDGFVMGEGSGILVLEEYEHAKARGAKMYAEVVGYGATGDAHHVTAPAPEGEGGARAIMMALRDGEMSPEEVSYFNAHGTSTPFNDYFETLAIKTAFGEHAHKLAISSTKSMTGHLLGAAGGVEAILTAKAVYENKVPPTIHLETSDEECDLDYVPNQYREMQVNAAISNSLGFGGHNACILMKKISE